MTDATETVITDIKESAIEHMVANLWDKVSSVVWDDNIENLGEAVGGNMSRIMIINLIEGLDDA